MSLQQLLDLVTQTAITLAGGLLRVIGTARQIDASATGDFPVPVALPPNTPFIVTHAYGANADRVFTGGATGGLYSELNEQGPMLAAIHPMFNDINDGLDCQINQPPRTLTVDTLFVNFSVRASVPLHFDLFVIGFPLT
jgi:hypothetical protein